MQIPLFDLPSPLDQTVGTDFFAKLPKEPGVYRMYGDAGELLYVGKAKNLRTRLMSYRRVRIGHSSTKTLRLVHSVSKIEIDPCVSEVQALVRENELLRTMKPPFNVVNTRPENYFYFAVQVHDDVAGAGVSREAGGLSFEAAGLRRATLEFSLTDQMPGAVFGAFKGMALCHRAFFSLRRVLWLLRKEPERETFRYPLEMFRKQKLSPHEFFATQAELNLLAGFLHGFVPVISPTKLEAELIASARVHFAQFEADEFHRNWMADDLATLERFFQQGPLRNRGLKSLCSSDSATISQSVIDDLIVQRRFQTSA